MKSQMNPGQLCGSVVLCLAAVLAGGVLFPTLPIMSAAVWAGQFCLSPAGALYVLEQSTLAQVPSPPPTAGPVVSGSTSIAPPAIAPQSTVLPLPTALPTWDGSIPEDCMPILSRQYPQGRGEGYVAAGSGSIKNCTALSDDQVAQLAEGGLPFTVEVGSTDPQVLILHTHATESYQLASPWYCPAAWSGRTTNCTENVCFLGEEMARILNDAGICTLHDSTLHDYPSYNGSYAASRDTAQAYLEKYPSLKIIIDLHRDAIEQGGNLIKPLAQVDGGDCAQVMLICGCDNGGNLPNFAQNLRFAAAWENAMESAFPGLTRPVLFDYRFYNQDLTTGCLLLEVGGHGNTLAEAERAATLAGQALAGMLGGKLR